MKSETVVTAPAPPAVVRVQEGRSNAAERIFSVTLDRSPEPWATPAMVEPFFAAVANAVDPATGLRLPRPGEAHPADAAMLAGEPMIFAVGVRPKAGQDTAGAEMCQGIASPYSCFYNVRVRYALSTARKGGLEA